eukprot:4631435-Amphidinium_carterae.1
MSGFPLMRFDTSRRMAISSDLERSTTEVSHARFIGNQHNQNRDAGRPRLGAEDAAKKESLCNGSCNSEMSQCCRCTNGNSFATSNSWGGGEGEHGMSSSESIISPRDAKTSEENYEDFLDYARSLGIDEGDMLWVAREAYVAPLPSNWSEYTDSEGRVYFCNQATQESRWDHPADAVFRELVELVKAVRAETPAASEDRRKSVMQEHLLRAREKAVQLLESWSGPYTAADGTQYYYHAASQMSTWDNP